MPEYEDATGPAGQAGPHLSRRSALRAAAGAGAAATALAVSGAPALAAVRPASSGQGTSHAAPAAHAAPDGDHADEPIVAHLRDARTGEIDVFRGTSQVRLHDQALAALLVRASS